MKKIIFFIISCLFLLTRSTDYTVKVDKINNVKNATIAMIKLEILDVGYGYVTRNGNQPIC